MKPINRSHTIPPSEVHTDNGKPVEVKVSRIDRLKMHLLQLAVYLLGFLDTALRIAAGLFLFGLIVSIVTRRPL